MLVLHVIIGLNVGGAELMLKRLVQLYAGNSDYQHTILSLTSIGSVGRQIQALGFEVHPIGMRSSLDIPFALWRLFRLIRTMRPDIVQTWMYHADLLGGLAARLAGVKNIVWGIRTTEVNGASFSATALVRKACAWLSSSVPRFIVCAADASRLSHIAIGYDATRMVVIPNGFDFVRFVPMPAQRLDLRCPCGFNADSVVVGYLGRFHSDKDQANFVRAAGLIAIHAPHVRFLMVGRELDASNERLQKWINETGHSNRFILLGERSDVPACLAAMDMFCLSSRTEGFPNVVGEAMAMGLPCVVTDVGDAAMLVADTGVVVPKENSTALAAGLSKLLAMSPLEREQLGQRAKERIHREFSMERARERFESLYAQLTKKESS
jgi:glycosyltransferase involved in cell wall biosynthesis